jgi:hypothetical protein
VSAFGHIDISMGQSGCGKYAIMWLLYSIIIVVWDLFLSNWLLPPGCDSLCCILNYLWSCNTISRNLNQLIVLQLNSGPASG